MEINKINLKSEFESIKELWILKNIGKVNNHVLKTIKLKGEFEMHKHEDGDKLFFVQEGTLFLEFPNNEIVEVNQGECVIVPKGTEQKPFSPEGVSLLLFEIES